MDCSAQVSIFYIDPHYGLFHLYGWNAMDSSSLSMISELLVIAVIFIVVIPNNIPLLLFKVNVVEKCKVVSWRFHVSTDDMS